MGQLWEAINIKSLLLVRGAFSARVYGVLIRLSRGPYSYTKLPTHLRVPRHSRKLKWVDELPKWEQGLYRNPESSYSCHVNSTSGSGPGCRHAPRLFVHQASGNKTSDLFQIEEK